MEYTDIREMIRRMDEIYNLFKPDYSWNLILSEADKINIINTLEEIIKIEKHRIIKSDPALIKDIINTATDLDAETVRRNHILNS